MFSFVQCTHSNVVAIFNDLVNFRLQLQLQIDAQLKQADDDISDIIEQVHLNNFFGLGIFVAHVES